MFRLGIGALVALLGCAAVPAFATDLPPFKQADQNGDGKVSIQEATQAGVSKKDAKVSDIDDDGKLTQRDWKFVDKLRKERTGQGSPSPGNGP